MKKLSFLFTLFLPLLVCGQNISFQDSNVKKICVHYWDTNGDSELSQAEAAAVTTLGTYFRDNSSIEIKYFSELKYFTGLKSIAASAFSSCKSLISITIPYSVTSIGNYAFKGCTNLTSFTIPYSVTSIGNYAFQNCSSLTSITIPFSITSIGTDAFNGCNSLTSVEFHCKTIGSWFKGRSTIKKVIMGDEVTTIGNSAFYGCSSLTSITFGYSLTSIESYAFSDCSGLTSFTIPNSVTYLGAYAFSGCSSLSTINISKSITSIGNNTFFGCSGLTSVTIPNSVTSIGNSAFSGCSGLTSVTIPNSVTSIGNSAFSGCSRLASFTIPYSVTTIGTDAFNGCNSLTSVEFHCKTIGSWFKGRSSIKKVIIGNDVTSIGNSAFSDCSGLTSITIPNSVTYLGTYAFSGCSSLSTINISNSITSIGNYAFYGCSSLTSIDIPNSVTSIGNYAFDNCSSLTSVTIPNSVTSIGTYAFDGCSYLETVTLGNSVKTIGANAFKNCSSITKVTVLKKSPPSITSDCFPNRYYIDLYVPSGCKSAYEKANYWWEFRTITEISDKVSQTLSLTSLPTLTYGDNYYTLPSKTDQGLTLNWNSSNTMVASISGNLLYINGAGTAIITAAQAGNDSYLSFNKTYDVTVAKAPLTISANDCQKQQGEANPTLTVSYSGFVNGDNANSLTKIPTVTTTATTNSPVGSYPIVPSGAESPNYSFIYKNGILTVIEPVNPYAVGDVIVYTGLNFRVTKIDGKQNNTVMLIKTQTSNANINIPTYFYDGSGRFLYSVTAIDDYAFSNCTGLKSISIPARVISIGKAITSGCSNLTEIVVNANNSYYDSRNDCNAVIQKYSMKLVAGCNTTVIPDGVTTIGPEAMRGMATLKSVNLPASLETIGDMAFYDCNSLTMMQVNWSNPLTVSSDFFSNYANCELKVPFGRVDAYKNKDVWKKFKSIVEFGNIIFADAAVKSLCIQNWDTNSDGELNTDEAASVASLDAVFKKAKITSFNELQYFTGLTAIGDAAFNGSTLKEVVLPETVTALNKDAFLDCKSLTSLHLPASVQAIGQNALSGCTAMTAITVDTENKAFCDIDGVLFSKNKETLVQYPAAKATGYNVPEGTKVLGRDAFYMSKLTSVTLPSTLKELGYDAFGYSTALTELTIPEGVTTIGDYILDGCRNVKTLRIPSSVTTIGQRMANGCSALSDVFCHMKAPFGINANNFTTTAYANATLHVKASLVTTYRSLDGWKNFATIKGDMVDYAFNADALTLHVGDNGHLVLHLANSGDIDGLQFDLALPAGVNIASDEEGEFLVNTTDRTAKLSASCVGIAEGSYRIILMSMKRAIVAAGEGAVVDIELACADDTEGGDHTIDFSNVWLSEVQGERSVNVSGDDFSTPLTIVKTSNIEGDADGNFTVDVTDVMMMVGHILNRFDSRFIFANADLDKNGVVNVTDVMNVVSIILHKPSAAPAHAKRMDRDLLGIGTTETGCQLLTAYDSPQITALQMTVTLPDGCRMRNAALTGEAARTHKMMTRQLDDRTYRVVVFSTSSAPLDADAAFMTFDLEGNGGLVSVEDILCTGTNLETIASSDLTAVLTGIGAIIADGDDTEAPVYNLAGQRMSQPRRGVNITKGKKVVVK